MVIIIVMQDLGGIFKYIVVDEELVLVDPKYLKEYKALINK